ncbi:DKNYY domain-containing protein [Prosthecobacter sp.]|uniref:DKNYY domain-containing protein n=1 Tax=Prosthecobacter sp. TaxID=1965333 RepID=UPI0037CAD86A
MLASCGKKVGYEIRGDKVIWNSWQGDGMFGKWSEAEVTDEHGFQILQPEGYAKNTQDVFHGGAKVDGADAATFQLLEKQGGLAKDAKRVYDRGAVIEGADPASFERTGMEGLGRDKKDYYLGTKPLHVRDMASFKVLDANACGKDDKIWARDSLDYYVSRVATPIADPATFQVIQSWYAKDARQVYFGSEVLAGADAASFQGIGGESGEFAKDSKNVYWQGKVVEGCDAATFQLLKYRFAKDSKHAYFCYSSGSPPHALPDSDGQIFEVIGPSSQGFGYAKDAKQVYQGANVITGADPATFVVDPSDPEKASDKNRRYQYGKPVQ